MECACNLSMTGGSWGLQIGGEAVDVVMLVMKCPGMEKELSSKFKIGAEHQQRRPVGRHVEGTTDWKMRAEVLTYSRARGASLRKYGNGASIIRIRRHAYSVRPDGPVRANS
jgi:lipid-binding SYLF domain-containing protein